jgi:hypothetical protein
MKLSKEQALEAARKLMSVVNSGRQWDVATADSCLPHGWELRNAEDSDFHPCTIRHFTSAFSAHARLAMMG